MCASSSACTCRDAFAHPRLPKLLLVTVPEPTARSIAPRVNVARVGKHERVRIAARDLRHAHVLKLRHLPQLPAVKHTCTRSMQKAPTTSADLSRVRAHLCATATRVCARRTVPTAVATGSADANRGEPSPSGACVCVCVCVCGEGGGGGVIGEGDLLRNLGRMLDPMA